MALDSVDESIALSVKLNRSAEPFFESEPSDTCPESEQVVEVE